MVSEFILTDDNYYSPEADMHYMSCSQFQGFQECEAKALAKIQKRWKDKPSKAFTVGNFFHSYFESPEAHERFCDENMYEIYTKTSIKNHIAGKGELELLSDFQQAKEMIRTLEKDPIMSKFVKMDGRNELFMTGEIFGIQWRMKMDKYIPDNRYIIDYKTVANIWETSYDTIKGERVTFVEAYGYLFRAAIYSLIEAQNTLGITGREAFEQLCGNDLVLADFMLLCVSKQEYPDKEIIRLNHKQAYIYELERIKNKASHFNSIKQGYVLPKRCGTCDYCRATKKITKIISYYELKPEFRDVREDDYCVAPPLMV